MRKPFLGSKPTDRSTDNGETWIKITTGLIHNDVRALQEGEVRPVGSNKARKVDVRIISASSVSLREIVDREQFREDLYFRLYVYPICVPTLRERSEDIHVLANHFLKKFARQQHKQAESLHEEILDFMRQGSWEGNIRELENFVERLVRMDHNENPVASGIYLHPERCE
jgi:transcriptional regulator with PAS, ATPase and Fis domain